VRCRLAPAHRDRAEPRASRRGRGAASGPRPAARATL